MRFCKAVVLSFLLGMAPLAEALPLWIRPDGKSGAFQVEQIQVRLSHFNTRWIGVEQKGGVVTGTGKESPDAFSFQGIWKVGNDPFRLEESIRRISSDTVEYRARVFSEQPVDTASIRLNFVLPLELLRGKSVWIGKERLRYPGKEHGKISPFSGVRQVKIELPEGVLEIRGEPFSAVFQDNRIYQPKNSRSPGTCTVHIHPQKSVRKKGEPTSAEFRYTFTFRGIRSVPLNLEKVANRGFRDDVAGDGKGGWNDQGPRNDLRMFRPGDYRFYGVEFQVLDPAGNGERNCIVLNGAAQTCFLNSAAIGCAGKKGRYLYLLHANAYAGNKEKSGSVSVKFADGSRQEILVRDRVDVGNWWGGIDWKNAHVVWKGTNDSSVLGLYMTGFELKRDDPVEITFGKGDYSVWMIVAATLTDRKASPYRPDSTVYILPGEKWRPILIQEVEPGSLLDFSRHVDAPAGKYGRVMTSKEGHFVFENAPKKRIRFLGVNLCADPGFFMTKKSAELFAERMARAGYNAVRLHHFEKALSDRKAKFSYELDPERLDLLDYLVYSLKKNGIYVTYDLYCSRKIRKGELPELGDFKAGVCFFDSYRENWKEFTRRLMTHVNPYTKMRWADDPVFFCLNLVNENPLILKWNTGGEKEILREYHRWLRAGNIDTPENRKARDGVFFRFLTEYQNRTILWMKEFVRKEIGSDTLITDLNCGGPNGPNPYLMRSRTLLDLVDQHTYNDHPMILESWNPPVLFKQKSLIPRGVGISALRMFGKPFLVSEYGFCHPNRFIAEHGPVMGAYAALQDWDGMIYFQYAWSHRCIRPEKEYASWSGYFDTLSNPVKRLSDYIVWFLFLRGDVRPAERGAAIGLEDLPWTQAGGAAETLMRLGKIERIGVLPEGQSMKNVRRVRPSSIPASGKVSVSSTGEIVSDNMLPEMKVITPKSECITTGKREGKAGALSFRSGTGFQTISVHSLDNRPIRESSSLLLFHLTDTKNTGEKFSGPDLRYLLDYGRAPMLQEIVSADVSLQLSPGNWSVSALNMSGSVKSTVKAVFREGKLRFSPSTGNALIYHLEKRR